ncbi:hypothetical protein C8A03DRAFT_13127 [Achaetomium macrosporum]|uniref:F-box domain-containing protein n=1 Tax=Achaetomium macrosporum TaxID=79813 RepID=A0AAN7CEE5_9PEZI|nr:hypothetical protein C8A03DRAFT_13127 [Achaetomium macrosporum]
MASLLELIRRPGGAARARPQNQAPTSESHKLTPSEQEGSGPGSERERTINVNAKWPRPTLATLPAEIHLLIAQHLSYPDALSLKHTNRHFYHLVDTGVRLKVEWLMERRLLHLECPSDQRCDLGSDLRFCRGSVKLLMQRRREHIECESRPGLGCLIYGTSKCPHARKLKTRLKRWMRMHATDPKRWIFLLVSLLPLLVGWLWMVGMMLL